MKQPGKYALTGALAGLANGLFGSGGGLFLVPLFTGWAKLPQRKAFATSVAVILPCPLCRRRCTGSGAGWMSPPPGPICWAGQWAACSLGKSSAGYPWCGCAGPLGCCCSTAASGRRWPYELAALRPGGAATGVLSGFGVGGGTLLLLWLTLVQGMEQLQAGA